MSHGSPQASSSSSASATAAPRFDPVLASQLDIIVKTTTMAASTSNDNILYPSESASNGNTRNMPPIDAIGTLPSPYVILCDAGSTGTRLYVYSLSGDPTLSPTTNSDGSSATSHSRHHQHTHHHHHNVQIHEGPKIRPGLSSQTPRSVTTYLLPAFDAALQMIPSHYHGSTPVYVYATAGMRLLSQKDQVDIYDALARSLQDHPGVPFSVERENFGTIDGEDEGYFAALAVNYLGGIIGSDLVTLSSPPSSKSSSGSKGKKGKEHPSRGPSLLGGSGGGAGSGGGGNGSRNTPTLLGALDLGGASAQIVFDAGIMSSGHRRRLQEAVEYSNQRWQLQKLTHPGMEEYYSQQQQQQRQQQHDGGDVNRPRALWSPPLKGANHLRGGCGGTTNPINSDGGRSVSRNDFFSLSLLGYGGESMRDGVDAYLERPEVAGERNRNRILVMMQEQQQGQQQLQEQQQGHGRRRLQASNLKNKGRPVNFNQRRQKQQQAQREQAQQEQAQDRRQTKKKHHHYDDHAKAQNQAQADPTIDNPCYPPGYTVTLPSGYTHVGSGNGQLCMEYLDAVMEEYVQGSCTPGQFCVDLLGEGIEPPVRETFYAFTLYSYPIDFARDVIAKIKQDNGGELPRGKEYRDLHKVDADLQSDNPSIKALRDVTNVACTWDYPFLLEALPEEDRIAFRCMELALSTSLLTKFGFPEDGHNIHFTDEIGGASAEWTLGAYLHLVNNDNNDAAAGSGGGWYSHPTSLMSSIPVLDSGLLYSDVAILMFALATVAMCVRFIVKRSWADSVTHHAKDGVKNAVRRMPLGRSISMPIR